MSPTTPTVREFAERWLREYCAPPYRSAYLGRNRAAALRCYILPEIGHLPLEYVDESVMLRAQRALFARKLERSTIQTAFGIFGEMWKIARVEGLVRHWPARGLPWPTERSKKPTVYLPDERDAIIRESRRQRAWFTPIVATVFLAGTRPSEAAGLRGVDVNSRACRVDITTPIASQEETAGKTAKSRRNIIVASELMDILEEWRPERDQELFSRNRRGNPADTETFSQNYLKPLTQRLGIDYRPLYAGRHTYITLALMGGAPAAVVAEYCGTSIQQIEESYLSWIGAIEDPMRLLAGKRGPAVFVGSHPVLAAHTSRP